MHSSTKERPKSALADYVPEKVAAKELTVSEKTMVTYRKAGIGPAYISLPVAWLQPRCAGRVACCWRAPSRARSIAPRSSAATDAGRA